MAEDVSREIATLEDKLQKLKAQQLAELREKRKAAQKVVDDLDAQIAAITGKDATVGKRKRTSSAEMRERIFDVLRKNPNGLIPTEISERTKLNYVSVVNFVKSHPDKIGSKRDGKRKRYFLRK